MKISLIFVTIAASVIAAPFDNSRHLPPLLPPPNMNNNPYRDPGDRDLLRRLGQAQAPQGQPYQSQQHNLQTAYQQVPEAQHPLPGDHHSGLAQVSRRRGRSQSPGRDRHAQASRHRVRSQSPASRLRSQQARVPQEQQYPNYPPPPQQRTAYHQVPEAPHPPGDHGLDQQVQASQHRGQTQSPHLQQAQRRRHRTKEEVAHHREARHGEATIAWNRASELNEEALKAIKEAHDNGYLKGEYRHLVEKLATHENGHHDIANKIHIHSVQKPGWHDQRISGSIAGANQSIARSQRTIAAAEAVKKAKEDAKKAMEAAEKGVPAS